MRITDKEAADLIRELKPLESISFTFGSELKPNNIETENKLQIMRDEKDLDEIRDFKL